AQESRARRRVPPTAAWLPRVQTVAECLWLVASHAPSKDGDVRTGRLRRLRRHRKTYCNTRPRCDCNHCRLSGDNSMHSSVVARRTPSTVSICTALQYKQMTRSPTVGCTGCVPSPAPVTASHSLPHDGQYRSATSVHSIQPGRFFLRRVLIGL